MTQISKRPTGEMSQEELEAEFKELAKALSPINARRQQIAKELEKRQGNANYDLRIKFMNKQQKEGMLSALKRDLGK